jgi:tRNA G18 (ribose-2'-O)-methylase SpoU
VFIVPHNDDYLAEGSSSDKKYTSQATDLQRASIIVVGEEGAGINQMKEQLNKKIRFSI